MTQLAKAHWKGGRPVSPSISVLIGEAIYNLRAALDYLVYELAKLDSGAEQHGTQFPIDFHPKRFEQRHKDFLKGVSAAHIDAIGKLQPCYGCQWTKTLVGISNPDKHRELTDSHAEVIIDIQLVYGDAHDFTALPGKIFHRQGRFPRWHRRGGQVCDVYVEGRFAIEVTSLDRTPVVKTLEMLKASVTDTLDAFKPEFE